MQKRSSSRHLYQRGSTWWGRIKIGGREHRRSLRTTVRAEAEKRLAAWRKSVIANVSNDTFRSEGLSFEKACVRWVTDSLPKSVKPSVVKRYSVSIASMAPHFRGKSMAHIDRKSIAEFVDARQKAGVTNSTIRRDLTALSRLMAACLAWPDCEMEANSARDYDRSVLLRVMKKPLSLPRPSDIETVMGAVPAAMRPLLRLLDQTGMRLNEVVGLESWQVDSEKRIIRLIKTKTNRPRTLNFVTPAGDAGPILDPIISSGRSGFLFPNRDGQPYVQLSTNFDQTMRRVVAAEEVEASGFRRFRVHDLRHAFAVRWLMAEGSIYRLQKHLGHSTIRTTEGYLDHLPEDLHEVVQGLANGHERAQQEGTGRFGSAEGAQKRA
jgi:integrase/recombinase XerD